MFAGRATGNTSTLAIDYSRNSMYLCNRNPLPIYANNKANKQTKTHEQTKNTNKSLNPLIV